MKVFAQKSDDKYQNYLAAINIPNIKNASSGVHGIFGYGGDTGGNDGESFRGPAIKNSKSMYFPSLVWNSC